MNTISNFLFNDSLVWPLYCYLGGYAGAWLLAFGLARLWSDEKKYGSYDAATHKAWMFAIVLHLIVGTLLIFYLTFKAIPVVVAWWHIPLYMLLYLFFVVLDVFLLLFLAKQDSQKKGRQTQTKSQRRRAK